jgi:hypothetical protein
MALAPVALCCGESIPRFEPLPRFEGYADVLGVTLDLTAGGLRCLTVRWACPKQAHWRDR